MHIPAHTRGGAPAAVLTAKPEEAYRMTGPLVLLFLAVTVFCLALRPLAARAADAPVSAAPAVVWSSGETKLTALQDRPGAMTPERFAGPASPQERAAYFPDGQTPSSINMFLLQKDGLTILFDTGNGERVQPGPGSLPDLIATKAFDPATVDYVFLTHMHGDHIGGLILGGERAFPRAKIVVAGLELDYWLGEAERNPQNGNAALAREVAQLYGEELLPPFAFGDTLPAGITAIGAAGHTPGHTVFQVDGDGESILVVGDLLHAAALQFPLPDECANFDMNAPEAVAARKRILNLAAEKGMPVAGMHIPFTGVGAVEKDGKGFRFTPHAALPDAAPGITPYPAR